MKPHFKISSRYGIPKLIARRVEPSFVKAFDVYWKLLMPDEKQALTKAANTNYLYLSQIANGHRNASKHFARLLILITGLPKSAFKKKNAA